MALFDTQLAVLANQAMNYFVSGVSPRRMGNAHPNLVPYQVFEAADGPLIVATGNDRQVRDCCASSAALDLADDPAYRTNADRIRHRADYIAALSHATLKLRRADLLEALEAAHVPAGPINTVAEAFANRQAVARGMVQEVAGSRTPRSPMRFSDAGIAAGMAPPRLDEHGDAIRAALDAGAAWPSA